MWEGFSTGVTHTDSRETRNNNNKTSEHHDVTTTPAFPAWCDDKKPSESAQLMGVRHFAGAC